jgi:DNA processing protein
VTISHGDSAAWEIDRDDDEYPAGLRDLPDPPRRLWGFGDPSLLQPGIAIIGSRRASPYGTACAAAFARVAAESGVPVVSGGAMGCDLEAHRAALEAGGPTVAVLGCGADVDYPRAGAETLSRIRDEGCVLSELPPGHLPRRWAFPRRNRIIAALAKAVLVVEAGLPSGTFSTADHALDIGRDVLAVPGSIFASGSKGTNRLVRQGAAPVCDAADFLDSLAAAGLSGVPAGPGAGPAFVDVSDPLLAALVSSPARASELAHALDRALPDVLQHLGRLESQGVVVRLHDGTYAPSRLVLETPESAGGGVRPRL